MNKKYLGDKATELRKRLWPERDSWRFMFVHGELDHPEELPYLKAEGVEIHSMSELLDQMRSNEDLPLKTDSGAAHFTALC